MEDRGRSRGGRRSTARRRRRERRADERWLGCDRNALAPWAGSALAAALPGPSRPDPTRREPSGVADDAASPGPEDGTELVRLSADTIARRRSASI